MYFLVYFLVQQFSNFVEIKSFQIDFNFVTNGLIISFAIYITLKILQLFKVLTTD